MERKYKYLGVHQERSKGSFMGPATLRSITVATFFATVLNPFLDLQRHSFLRSLHGRYPYQCHINAKMSFIAIAFSGLQNQKLKGKKLR